MKMRKDRTFQNMETRIPVPARDEYLIIQEDATLEKYALAKVIDNSDGIVHVVYAKDAYDPVKRTESSIKYKNVMMNLGKNPLDGIISGVRIEKWYDTKASPLGDVHFFTELSKESKKLLKKCIWKVADVLEKTGLDGFLPIEVHVRTKGGSISGYYKTKSRGIDIVGLCPKNWDAMDEILLTHILFHELSHGVDIHLVPNKGKITWIKEYLRFIKIWRPKKEQLARMCTEFMEYGKEYQPGGFDLSVFNEIKDFMRKKRKITWKELLFIQQENNTYIKDIWPTSVELADHKTVITEYAKKNVIEFFAESMAFHLAKRDTLLPETTIKLCKKTVKQCGRNDHE